MGFTQKTPRCFSEWEGLAENRSAADSELRDVFYNIRQLRTMQVGLSPKNKLFNERYIRIYVCTMYAIRHKVLKSTIDDEAQDLDEFQEMSFAKRKVRQTIAAAATYAALCISKFCEVCKYAIIYLSLPRHRT